MKGEPGPSTPTVVWLGPRGTRRTVRGEPGEKMRVRNILQESDIPPGSLISERTLADIREGRYGIAAPKGTPFPGGKLARQMMRRRLRDNA